jgi:hypothetical protein
MQCLTFTCGSKRLWEWLRFVVEVSSLEIIHCLSKEKDVRHFGAFWHFFFLPRCSHTWELALAFGASGWVSSVSWSGTVGRTPSTGDQLVARPLHVHTHRKAHTHTQTQTLNIHALSRIRTHGPGFRASEDSARLRPLGYRERPSGIRDH